jgi:UDP-glucose 4-epimerase
MPLGCLNPYGWTKYMIEQMLRDLCEADEGLGVALLRYFNPIGADKSGLIGDDPQGIPNNLLPFISRVAAGTLPELSIFGDDYSTPDGTCIRDYIHVSDLALAHVLAAEYIEEKRGAFAFNIGTGKGTSVLEMVAAFEKACGFPIKRRMAPRRAGDLESCYANTDLAEKELGFKASKDIEEMVADTWHWQKTGAVIK